MKGLFYIQPVESGAEWANVVPKAMGRSARIVQSSWFLGSGIWSAIMKTEFRTASLLGAAFVLVLGSTSVNAANIVKCPATAPGAPSGLVQYMQLETASAGISCWDFGNGTGSYMNKDKIEFGVAVKQPGEVGVLATDPLQLPGVSGDYNFDGNSPDWLLTGNGSSGPLQVSGFGNAAVLDTKGTVSTLDDEWVSQGNFFIGGASSGPMFLGFRTGNVDVPRTSVEELATWFVFKIDPGFASTVGDVFKLVGIGSCPTCKPQGLSSVELLNGGDEFTYVPIPAAVWLLGSGLLGLFGIGRRRRTTVAA